MALNCLCRFTKVSLQVRSYRPLPELRVFPDWVRVRPVNAVCQMGHPRVRLQEPEYDRDAERHIPSWPTGNPIIHQR